MSARPGFRLPADAKGRRRVKTDFSLALDSVGSRLASVAGGRVFLIKVYNYVVDFLVYRCMLLVHGSVCMRFLLQSIALKNRTDMLKQTQQFSHLNRQGELPRVWCAMSDSNYIGGGL